tara:strand:- start:18432 stop:19079 length:648 start_codon:yes stop_codon:yes gene_type:complete
MAITNYSELKTAVANWTARSDLGTYVDEFIDLAETFLKRIPVPAESPEIGGVRGNITRATGTLTAGTATLSLPSDFQEIYRMTLTGSTFVTLRYVTPNQIAINHRTGSGLPSYFTISDVIEFDVAPDSNYAYELSYYPGVTALSDSNTTNWILTNYPDTYLAATLFHAFRFLQDEQSAAGWLGQYKQASWSASETYRLPRTSQGSVGIKTDSANP